MRGEDWERELELGLALPVVPKPGATGGPEYGRCRQSSRIRALPVVANPGAAGRPTASDHTEIELALGPEHRPRDGDKWGTARRQPRCRSDDRFWERKVRGRRLGTRVGAWLGAAGRPECGRCRSSPIRALPVVWNPGGADRPEPNGKRVGRFVRSTDRETAITGGRPVGNRVAGALTDFGSGLCGANYRESELELGWALPVDPNAGAAGRHQYGRCRASRIRALPVVANPCAAGRPTASDHTESELAFGSEHRPREGDKWRNAPWATELLQR